MHVGLHEGAAPAELRTARPQAKFGSDIDEHDAVFRLNNAPTVGFEKYVGSKTTFNLLNRWVHAPPAPLPPLNTVSTTDT